MLTRTRWGRAAAVVALLVTAAIGAEAGDDPPAQPPAQPPAEPPAPEVPPDVMLPAVSQASKAPAEEDSAIVKITPKDGIAVEGKVVKTFTSFRSAMVSAASGAVRESDGTCPLNLVIRADEDAPWTATLWTMQLAADPAIRVYRIHFAVKHKKSGEEGVVSVTLPRDRAPEAPAAGKGPPTMRMTVAPLDDAKGISPEAVYAAVKARLAKQPGARVVIDLPKSSAARVRHGSVVRIVDACLRAGVADVLFGGVEAAKPPADLAGEFAKLTAMPKGGVSVNLAGAAVEDAGEGQPPIPDGYSPSGMAASPKSPGIALVPWVPTEEAPPPSEQPPAPGMEGAGMDEPGMEAGGMEEAGGMAAEPAPGAGAKEPPKETGPIDAREKAGIQAALEWLASHSSREEGWQAGGFQNWCDGEIKAGKADGVGKPVNDVGVTALALTAFLGAGHTPKSGGAFGKVVANGFQYLTDLQDGDGCFGERTPPGFVYAHAVATIAMIEAHRLTGDAKYLGPAKKGVAFVLASRSEEAPWKHGPLFGEGAGSATAWMALVLDAARRVNEAAEKGGKPAPFALDPEALPKARPWLEKDVPPATRAAALLMLGDAPDGDALKDALPAVVAKAPEWTANPADMDILHWLWGSTAAYRAGDEAWSKWRAAQSAALLAHQHKDGARCDVLGSFDAVGPSGAEGGRVLSTALAALCLETPLRLARPEAPPPK